MKKAVFALVGIAAESLAWMAALFLCSEFFEQAVRGWLGDRYFETYGRGAHPALVLYFVGFFLLITGCAALVNRLMKLKSGEIVVLLGVVNFLWLGGMVFGYALQNVFVI